MAYNLPVEGESGPFVGSALLPVPTCLPTDRAGEASGNPFVVVTAAGVVLGALEPGRLAAASEEAQVIDLMELGPGTIRPSLELADLDEEAAGALVTLPNGVVLGVLDPDSVAGGQHPDT
ncbi:MAG: hypothetical protein LC733_03125 [Actinobacteria bacterium]|nr:hypothetical protein [Actinomycetota bacterium]